MFSSNSTVSEKLSLLSSYLPTAYRVWLIWAVMCLLAASRVQLFGG